MTEPLTPRQALRQYFGLEHFRDGQEAVIRRVLQGQHTLLVMPTGSGKSLTYQLPALLLPGLTLVISPLIALMKDQVDGLVEAGLQATYINSSLPSREINRRMRALLEGHVKLLYIAPERLRSRNFTHALARLKVSLLAVDEAHCISQWGHDFRPDYLQIGPTWQAMGRPTLLATTATATKAVQQDIMRLLGLSNAQSIITGFNRPNLRFRVESAPDVRTKLRAVQAILNTLDGSAIIYTATRRNADEVAEFVRGVMGHPAQAYHAGMDRHLRHQVQTDFMADRLKVVVATNAFGMGVDKADVRAVVHYNMPATVEAYYQEAGRAGRDGATAECVLLFAPDDLRLQEWLISADTPTYEDLHQVYHRLHQAADGDVVYFAVNELAEITGLHRVKIRVILSELELAGVLLHLGDQGHYSQWKVLPLPVDLLIERSRAIGRRAQIRRELLAKMLDYAYATTCRRVFLLNYFGDTSPPRAPGCCDNHAGQNIEDLPKAVTPQEWFPLIVLETARSLQQRPVGRQRLVQLLTGSRAKAMRRFGYDRHKFYGKLGAFSQPQISDLISTLIEGKYLRITGSRLPVLTLTALGLQALEARAALPVRIAGLAVEEDQIEQWRTRTARSDTMMETFKLFDQGLTPAQIAAARGLVENTIYGHLARLIADGKIDLHQVVPANIEAQIVNAVETAGGVARLRPIKELLADAISFDQIRCVIAAHPEFPRHIQTPEESEPIESPAAGGRARLKSQDSIEVILAVVSDLDGLLTPEGVGQLLTAGSGEVVPFSDHRLCGKLQGVLSPEQIATQIQEALQSGHLTLSPHQRLTVR